MKDDQSHQIALTIFAGILAVAILFAFVTTLENVDSRQVNNEAQPGTIGLARPHAPLGQPPGEAARN